MQNPTPCRKRLSRCQMDSAQQRTAFPRHFFLSFWRQSENVASRACFRRVLWGQLEVVKETLLVSRLHNSAIIKGEKQLQSSVHRHNFISSRTIFSSNKVDYSNMQNQVTKQPFYISTVGVHFFPSIGSVLIPRIHLHAQGHCQHKNSSTREETS